MELPSSDRWHEINDLLIAAQEQPARTRPVFLQEACGEDEALRREVEALLDAVSTYGEMVEGGAAALARPLVTAEPDSSSMGTPPSLEPGHRVGPYRLLKPIGDGGTSIVYRAERADDQFEREVAIKVLRHVVDPKSERAARFRTERQILASLSHPHLAEVYDGGVTNDGRPYLVMEYVDGRPITDHCRVESCPLKERLTLFRQASEAVQAAHEQLVVHRDLKPSNVLVERAAGQVKLLDFGIAKILGDLPGDSLPATRTGRQPMTPAYAAPEQVKGEPISVATDTYALGVLLYELLTGKRPYETKNRSPYAVARAVCEEQPERPSEVVNENRKTALQGDLDAIVMKALRKEPGARYDTVDALVNDLERYRTDRPVRAKQGTWTYRAQKFVHRNRRALVGTVATLILLAGLGAYHVHRLSAERDQARRAAQKAEQVSDFLVELFQASDPSEALGDTVTAQELLQRGVERASALDNQPVVKAQMLLAMGQAYEGLGRYEDAKPLLQDALSTRRSVFGNRHEEVARVTHSLGVLAYRRRAYDRADSLFERSLQIRRALHEGPHPDVAESLNDLAVVRRNRNMYASADTLYQKALSMRRVLHGPESSEVVSTLNNLAVLKNTRGHYEEAEELYREVLATRRTLLGDDHPRVANTLNNLANALRQQGEMEKAEARHREALSMRRRLLGNDHPKVAESLNGLGNLLRDRGTLAEAAALHREALSIRREQYGPNHVRVANSLNNLAMVLRQRGQYEDAAQRQRRASEIYRSELGAQHRYVGVALDNLADIRREKEGCAAALPSYRRAQQILEESGSENGITLAEVRGWRGTCLVENNKYEEAAFLLQQSYDVLASESRPLKDTVRHALEIAHDASETTEQFDPYQTAQVEDEAKE